MKKLLSIFLLGAALSARSQTSVLSTGADPSGVADCASAFNTAFATNNVYIPAGTYVLKSQVKSSLSASKFKIIIDPGAIFVPADSFPTGTAQNNMFLIQNKDTVSWNGGAWHGRRSSMKPAITGWQNFIYGLCIMSSNNVTVQNVTMDSMPSTGIDISYCRNVVTKNNVLTHGLFNNIHYQSVTFGDVCYNTIFGSGNMGSNLSVGGIGILATLCDTIHIHHNTIDSTGDTGSKTEGSDSVEYAYNTIRYCGKDAIKVQGYTNVPLAYHAYIHDNVCTNLYYGRPDGSALIMFLGVRNGKISNNTVTGGWKIGGEEEGIRTQYYDINYPNRFDTIINNTIINPITAGMTLTSLDSSVVSGNVVRYQSAPQSLYEQAIQMNAHNSVTVSNNYLLTYSPLTYPAVNAGSTFSNLTMSNNQYMGYSSFLYCANCAPGDVAQSNNKVYVSFVPGHTIRIRVAAKVKR